MDERTAPLPAAGIETRSADRARDGRGLNRTVVARLGLGVALLAALVAASLFAASQRRGDIEHVYLIVLENHGTDQIVGSPEAPYLNELIRGYGLATDYRGVAHPSQPNYFTLVTGSTQGIRDDEAHDVDAASLFDQLDGNGRSWRVFAQNYPGNCFTGSSASGGPDLVGAAGEYVRRHNPAISLTRVRNDPARCARIVPLASFDPGAASFEMVVPNNANNMHSGGVAAGDRFLRDFVPRILSSPSFDRSVLFITFDEGSDAASGGGRVPLIVVRPGIVPGYRSPTTHTHRALLRTIEDLWHLPCLAGACTAPAMTEFFGG